MISEVGTALKTGLEVGKDVGKEVGRKVVDITKRIESQEKAVASKPEKVDITKRIPPDNIKETKSMDLKEIAKDYINDLKERSVCPDTISASAINVSKLEIQPAEKVADMRDKFDEMKSQLRKIWSEINGQEWPTYKEDVLNKDGKVIRHAGDKYDAHHIQPLKLGGLNEASNITPLDLTKHSEVHMNGGSCTKLVNGVTKGVERL